METKNQHIHFFPTKMTDYNIIEIHYKSETNLSESRMGWLGYLNHTRTVFPRFCRVSQASSFKALVSSCTCDGGKRIQTSGGSFIMIIRCNKFIHIMVHNEGIRQALECSEFMQHKII